MRSDRLEELLERADAQLPPPRPAAGRLAERVRARSARRTRMQAGVGIAASLVIATIGMHRLHDRPPHLAGTPSPARTSFDLANCRAELAQLDALAALHRRAADEIESMQRVRATRRQVEDRLVAGRDPLASLADARDRAARIMLLDADRLDVTPGEQPRAQAIYRRAVQLFPDTPAARLAAQRLKDVGA